MEDDGRKDSIIFSAWDYGGQDVFYSLHPLFLTRYGVYLAVFSMAELRDDEAGCLAYLRFWLHSIVVHARGPKGDTAPIIMVGTHKDVVSPRLLLFFLYSTSLSSGPFSSSRTTHSLLTACLRMFFCPCMVWFVFVSGVGSCASRGDFHHPGEPVRDHSRVAQCPAVSRGL